MLPYAKQSISKDDIKAVSDVLASDFITQGDVVPQFETAIAQYCGVDYAIAVSNGTAALHLACLALGVTEGDWVWTSPNTFVASANCALYCGAGIDFVDIDPLSYTMSVTALKEKLQQAKHKGCLPKVVIPVHFSGQSCLMAEIQDLSQEYGFAIIEDAAHALGGEYAGEKIGTCQYCDITIFSFHPAKMITTGEGGMLVTQNKALAETATRLRSHGISKNTEQMINPSVGEWYYEQHSLGFNYRLTDIQAMLGLSQLTRLDTFVAQRRALARYYNEQLISLPVILPKQAETTNSCWHLYVIRLDLSQIDCTREKVFAYLREQGIGVHVHYIPVHTQPYFQALGFAEGDFPQSEAYYQSAITLPLFVDLTTSDIDYIVRSLELALQC